MDMLKIAKARLRIRVTMVVSSAEHNHMPSDAELESNELELFRGLNVLWSEMDGYGVIYGA